MTTQTSPDLYAPKATLGEDSVTLAVKMPRTMRSDFTALCKSKGIDMSEVIRRFIDRELAASK